MFSLARTKMTYIPGESAGSAALIEQYLADRLGRLGANAETRGPVDRQDDASATESIAANSSSTRADISPAAHRRVQIAARLEEIKMQFEAAQQEAGPFFGLAKNGAEASPTTSSDVDAEQGDEQEDGAAEEELTKEQQNDVRELKERDREVRTHEQAHLAAAGNLANGGPTYTYQTGPDGKQYAIGGEVNISLSKGRTPEETVERARRAYRAALAPADPSPTDRRVAAKASRMIQQAHDDRQEETKAGKTAANEADGEDKGERIGGLAPQSATKTDKSQWMDF